MVDNCLIVKVVDPQHLLIQNKIRGYENSDAFTKTIDAVHLFKYLKLHDIESQEYEEALNPIRYRNFINTPILKQYLRDNMFVGELEVEVESKVKGV